MVTNIDPDKNPILFLENIFGYNDSSTIPIIDIASFMSERVTARSSEEHIYCKTIYKKKRFYFRLWWNIPDKSDINFDIRKWSSAYLDENKLNSIEGNKVQITPNIEIQDIFLHSKDNERHKCNFTPIVFDGQFALLFQFFVKNSHNFIYSFLKWEPHEGRRKDIFRREDFRYADDLLEKHPEIQKFITIEHEYYRTPEEKTKQQEAIKIEREKEQQEEMERKLKKQHEIERLNYETEHLIKINMFIDKITKNLGNPLSQLIAILEARGFIFEKAKKGFFLVDIFRDENDYPYSLYHKETFATNKTESIDFGKRKDCLPDFRIPSCAPYLEDVSAIDRIDSINRDDPRDYPPLDISDHPDLRYLKEIFATDTFQSITNGELIKEPKLGLCIRTTTPVNALKNEQLLKIFHQGGWGIDGEGGGNRGLEGKSFFNSTRGAIVAVKHLDPFIARLIRALSAINISTSMACDGHFLLCGSPSDSALWIDFSTDYDILWFKAIYEKFISSKVHLEFDWDINNNHMSIKKSLSDKENIIMYLEIQKVAKILLKNREYLQIMKQCVIKNLKEKYNGNLYGHSNEEKIGIFESQFNDCISKTALKFNIK